MPKSLETQLLSVVRRIINASIDEVIKFAQSTFTKLGLDALKGLARAVEIYLGDREILSCERQKLRTFCKNSSDSAALKTFYKEVKPVFA